MSCNKLSGEFTKQVAVSTNDASNPQATLYCKGKILEPAVLEPNRLNFGQVRHADLPVSKRITITRGDGGPIAPALVTPLKAFETTLTEVKPGEQYELDIVLRELKDDRAREDVVIQTGVSESPTLKLTAFAHAVPRVSIRPTRFLVPTEATGETRQTVNIMWSDAPFDLVSATVQGAELKTELRQDGKQRQVVLIVPPNHELSGAVNVVVKTTDPQSPEMVIPVRAVPQRRTPAPGGRAPIDRAAARPTKPTAEPEIQPAGEPRIDAPAP